MFLLMYINMNQVEKQLRLQCLYMFMNQVEEQLRRVCLQSAQANTGRQFLPRLNIRLEKTSIRRKMSLNVMSLISMCGLPRLIFDYNLHN